MTGDISMIKIAHFVTISIDLQRMRQQPRMELKDPLDVKVNVLTWFRDYFKNTKQENYLNCMILNEIIGNEGFHS